MDELYSIRYNGMFLKQWSIFSGDYDFNQMWNKGVVQTVTEEK